MNDFIYFKHFSFVEVDTGVEELIQKYLKEIEDLRYIRLSCL